MTSEPLSQGELEAAVLKLGDRCAALERLLDRARLVCATYRTGDGGSAALHAQILRLAELVARLDRP